MALSTERWGIMVFLIIMTSEAGFPCGDFPIMGGVAGCTGGLDVATLLVFPAKSLMARLAIHQGGDFLLLEMTGATPFRHHRRRGGYVMTGDAVEGWPKACPMAKVAEDLGVLSLQWPWMPRLCAGRCGNT